MPVVPSLNYYLPRGLLSDTGDEILYVGCLVAPDVSGSFWAETTAFHGTPVEKGPSLVITAGSSRKNNLFFWIFLPFP